jgi:hypothetical protein
MNTFSARTSVIFLGAGALLLTTASEAQMPIVPLKSEISVTQVAQGCGPGRWRAAGGWGWCRGPGNRRCKPGYDWDAKGRLREPDAVLARRRAAEHDRAWNQWLDTRLDQRISDERDTVLEIVAQALALALEDESRDFKQRLHEEVRALRTELAELSTVVSELRQVTASEHARVVDLPPLPLAQRVN